MRNETSTEYIPHLPSLKDWKITGGRILLRQQQNIRRLRGLLCHRRIHFDADFTIHGTDVPIEAIPNNETYLMQFIAPAGAKPQLNDLLTHKLKNHYIRSFEKTDRCTPSDPCRVFLICRLR